MRALTQIGSLLSSRESLRISLDVEMRPEEKSYHCSPIASALNVMDTSPRCVSFLASSSKDL